MYKPSRMVSQFAFILLLVTHGYSLGHYTVSIENINIVSLCWIGLNIKP